MCGGRFDIHMRREMPAIKNLSIYISSGYSSKHFIWCGNVSDVALELG